MSDTLRFQFMPWRREPSHVFVGLCSVEGCKGTVMKEVVGPLEHRLHSWNDVPCAKCGKVHTVEVVPV